MAQSRGNIDTDGLLKIILVLVVIWLGLEVLEAFVGSLADALGVARPIVGLVILALLVAWLLDYI